MNATTRINDKHVRFSSDLGFQWKRFLLIKKKLFLLLFIIIVVVYFLILSKSSYDLDFPKGIEESFRLDLHRSKRQPYKYDINSTLINNPHIYDYTINPSYSICDSNDILFIAFVATAPQDFEKRLIIRKTWADKQRFKQIRVIFPLGISNEVDISELVDAESKENNDIIQENFIDAYHNLTQKIMMSYRWINEYCPQATYIVRLNDDLVLNTYAMIGFWNNKSLEM